MTELEFEFHEIGRRLSLSFRQVEELIGCRFPYSEHCLTQAELWHALVQHLIILDLAIKCGEVK